MTWHYMVAAKLMYHAITLAVKAKSRDERLEESDEIETLATAEANWSILEAGGHTAEALAAIIYRPLQVNEASKAIAAQYAAHLVRIEKTSNGPASNHVKT